MTKQAATLACYRAAVDDPAEGGALVALMDEISRENVDVELPRPTRSRVPAPYPRDHPRRDLLRLDGMYALERLELPRNSAHPPSHRGWPPDRGGSPPLHRWLVANL